MHGYAVTVSIHCNVFVSPRGAQKGLGHQNSSWEPQILTGIAIDRITSFGPFSGSPKKEQKRAISVQLLVPCVHVTPT